MIRALPSQPTEEHTDSAKAVSEQKDALFCQKVNATVSRFVSKEALAEVSRGMDTQMNESLNNDVSWFAPKCEVLWSTGSLQNRLSMTIGVNSLGFLGRCCKLHAKLGTALTPDIRSFSEAKD